MGVCSMALLVGFYQLHIPLMQRGAAACKVEHGMQAPWLAPLLAAPDPPLHFS